MSSEEKPSGIPVSVTRTIPIKLTSTPANVPEVHIKEVSQPEDLSEISEASQSIAHIIQIRRLNRPSSMYQPKLPEDSEKLGEPEAPVVKPKTPKLDMRKQEENESASHVLKDSNLIAIKAVGIILECPGDVESTSEEATSSEKIHEHIKKPVEKKPSLQSVESASSQFDVSEIPLDLVEIRDPDEEIGLSEEKQDVDNLKFGETPIESITVKECEREESNEVHLPQTASAPVLDAETPREHKIIEEIEHGGRSKNPSPEEERIEEATKVIDEESKGKEEKVAEQLQDTEQLQNTEQLQDTEQLQNTEQLQDREQLQNTEEPLPESIVEKEIKRETTVSEEKIEVVEEPVVEKEFIQESSEVIHDSEQKVEEADEKQVPLATSEVVGEEKPEEDVEETKKEDSATVVELQSSDTPQEPAPVVEELFSPENPSTAPEEPVQPQEEPKKKLDPIDDPDHPDYRPIIHQQSFEIPIIFDNTPNSLTQRAESLQNRFEEELAKEENQEEDTALIPVESEDTGVDIPVTIETEDEKPGTTIIESQYEMANEEGSSIVEESKKEFLFIEESSDPEVVETAEKVEVKDPEEVKVTEAPAEEKPLEEQIVEVKDNIPKDENKESETVQKIETTETAIVITESGEKVETEIHPVEETPVQVPKESDEVPSEKAEEEDGFVIVSSDIPVDEIKVQQEKEKQEAAVAVESVPETLNEEKVIERIEDRKEEKAVEEIEDKKEEKAESPSDIKIEEVKIIEKSSPNESPKTSPEPGFVMVPEIKTLVKEEKSEPAEPPKTESKSAPLAKEESVESKEPSPLKQTVERRDSFDISNMKRESVEEKPKTREKSETSTHRSRIIPQIVETKPELDPDDIDIVIEEAGPEDRYPVTLRKHKQEKESATFLIAEETREGTPKPIVAVAPTSRIEKVKEREEKQDVQETKVRTTSVITTDEKDDSEAPLIRVKRTEVTTEFDVYQQEKPRPHGDHGFVIKKEVLDESEEIAQRYRDREEKLKERLAKQSTSPTQLGPKQNSAQKPIDESKFFARKILEEQHRLSPKRIVITNQLAQTSPIHTDLREANQELTHSPKSPSPSKTEESLSPRTLTRIHNLNVVFENGKTPGKLDWLKTKIHFKNDIKISVIIRFF